MGLVNHLKDLAADTIYHAQAYGKHVVTGNLAKSIVVGSSPTHQITVQEMLGRGEWDGCEGLWFKGLEITPANYKFHPGKQTDTPTLKTFTGSSSTDKITSTAHGMNDGDEIIFKIGDLPAPLIAGVLYFVRDKTTNDFKVTTTSGGSAMDLTINGSGTLKFYKNETVQGVDEVFNTDVPHSNVTWIRAALPVGVGDADTQNSLPTGLKGIFRTTKCYDYNSSGVQGTYAWTTNAALQVADLILRIGGRPNSRIHWPSWCDWRDFLAGTISHDYTALASDFDGFGLRARYYNGTNFDTLIIDRMDPVILFALSSGSPGIGVNVDNFSGRLTGYIKAPYTESFTFSLTHTHGARLWIDDLTTALIDQWTTTGTHTASKSLTAGTFYPFKLEWKHTTGDAELRLEWQSISQTKEVISHRALYPETVNRARYETHPFFNGPIRLDDAVRTILNLCNSTVQEVDGKLRFFCLEQLSTPSFHITNEMIVDGTVKLLPRDVTSLRNSWQAKFRNVDAQYLDEDIDPVIIERPALQDTVGRKIDGEAINLYNANRHQAYRTLNQVVKRAVDPQFGLQLTGMADTYEVLAGDRVTVDLEFLDETDQDCLVVESNDSSSEETADERTFSLQEWTLS